MSTRLVTNEDYAFFDMLNPLRWPNAPQTEIDLYRNLVETGELQIETVYENTLAILSNGLYTRVAGEGLDFCDGSEAKKAVSQFRPAGGPGRVINSIKFTKAKNKTGLIRASGYSKYSSSFYHFAFPYSAYKGIKDIEVTLDAFKEGTKLPLGIPAGKWSKFLVGSIQELATITEQEAELLPHRYMERLRIQLKQNGNISDELVDRLLPIY